MLRVYYYFSNVALSLCFKNKKFVRVSFCGWFLHHVLRSNTFLLSENYIITSFSVHINYTSKWDILHNFSVIVSFFCCIHYSINPNSWNWSISKWAGHVLCNINRMVEDRVIKKVYRGQPGGNKLVRKPRMQWRIV